MTQDEKDLFREMFSAFGQQLDQRERIYQAQAERAQGLAKARRAKDEEHRARQQKWMTFIGAAGILVAILMGAFITSIWIDMNEMRRQMVKMGGFMASMEPMAVDMNEMNVSMGSMRNNFGSMTGDMAVVRGVLTDMRENLTPAVVSMSNDVHGMNTNVNKLSYDTAVMRTGVSRMANDTHAMGKPFRAMNDFIPW